MPNFPTSGNRPTLGNWPDTSDKLWPTQTNWPPSSGGAAFTPWTDPSCLAFIYAGQAGQTTAVGGAPSVLRTTIIPNLVTPAQTFTIPATFQGAAGDTSIGGMATWVADTLLTTLSNATIAIPAINATGASVFIWEVARCDASPTGFEQLSCIGSGNDPGIRAQFSGAGVSSVIAGFTRTVTSGAGYTQGVAKRIVAYFSGADNVDYIQWGSVSSGAGATATSGASSGAAIFNRTTTTAPSTGGKGAWGVFTATGANAAARTAAAASLVAQIDSWAATYYGGAWGALAS